MAREIDVAEHRRQRSLYSMQVAFSRHDSLTRQHGPGGGAAQNVGVCVDEDDSDWSYTMLG